MPNRIQVSSAVHVRRADDFTFEERGDIEVEGNESIHTWFLLDRNKD